MSNLVRPLPRSRLVCGIALSLAAISCGSTAAPAPIVITPQPANISGSYSGTFESGNYSTVSILVNLTQTGGTVSGTWAQSSSGSIQPQGNINGTADPSSFTGTLTYNYTNGPTCSGTLSAAGLTNAPANLTFTSVGLTTGNCGVVPNGNPLNIRFVLTRR